MKRPTLLRHSTDDGTLVMGSSQVITPMPGKMEVDKAVKVNLLNGSRGKTGIASGSIVAPGIGGRLTAMAQGTEGRYVVGGGQCRFSKWNHLLSTGDTP